MHTPDQLRVAVTGGAGFIGTHFCRSLAGMSALESILDLRPPRDSGAANRIVVGDVRDPDALRAAFQGANAILHLAAAHHDFGIHPDTYFAVNEGAAREICRVADDLSIRRICFYSTVAVYGSDRDSPGEEDECRPETPYGESKLAGERVFRRWTEQGGGRSVLVIRPTVTFGPGHFANVYTLIRQIASRLYLPVGQGANRKSLVYVENLVAATLHLWRRPDPPAFDVFNAVDKPDLSSREISDAVYRGLGRRPPFLRIPLGAALLAAKPFDAVISLTGANLPISTARLRKFAVANTSYSADKLQATGFKQTVSLEDGMEQMVEWYLREGRTLPIDRSIPPRESVGRFIIAEQGVTDLGRAPNPEA